MLSYVAIRSEVEEIAAHEPARGGTWEAGFGRAAVEYWFEDLANDSVTPLPLKVAVAIAICDLKHQKIKHPDTSEEAEALFELSKLVRKEDMENGFPREDLKHMEDVLQGHLPQKATSQIESLFSGT